jgi:uridine monophosphate synthetase
MHSGYSDTSSTASESMRLEARPTDRRKHSIVSISTTISTRSEPLSPQPSSTFLPATAENGSSGGGSIQGALARLGPIPYLRSILLLAQMSSEDNLITPEYTYKCLQMARQHPDFVLGFISQQSINSDPNDNFLTLTPGVQLPGQGSASTGDGLGQQYRTPKDVVTRDGADIIIVGRGILDSNDRTEEAERYRKEAWAAYEARVRINP